MSESLINTSCKECVFRENDENGTQIGCELRILDRFKERDDCVVKSVDNHFLLEGRICIYCRDKTWLNKISYYPDGQPLGIVDYAKLEAIKRETALKHTYVIFYNDGNCLDELRETVIDCQTQYGIDPIQIIVVNNKNYSETSKIKEILFESSIKKYNCVTIFGENIQEKRKYNNDECMQFYLKHILGGVFTTVNAGFIVHPKTTIKIHTYLNEKMGKFSLLINEDKNKNLWTYHTYTTKFLKGNLPYFMADKNNEGEHIVMHDFMDKVNYSFKEMIKKWDEI